MDSAESPDFEFLAGSQFVDLALEKMVASVLAQMVAW